MSSDSPPLPMSAAEKQREARRKRILENADQRMNRIIGREATPTATTNGDLATAQYPPTPAIDSDDDMPTNESFSRPPFAVGDGVGEIRLRETSNNTSPVARHFPSPSSQRSTATHTNDGPAATQSPMEAMMMRFLKDGAQKLFEESDPSAAFDDDDSGSELDEGTTLARTDTNAAGRRRHQRQKSASPGAALTQTLLTVHTLLFVYHAHALLLGAALRLLLSTGVGVLIAHSVVAPFIAVEAAVFYLQRRHFADRRRSTSRLDAVLSAGMMMVGVDPQLTAAILQSYVVTTQLFADFCHFLFAFVVVNTLCTPS